MFTLRLSPQVNTLEQMEEMVDSTESVFSALSHPAPWPWEHSTVRCRHVLPHLPAHSPGLPAARAGRLCSAPGRRCVRQGHLRQTSVFQAVQTVQGYPFRTARQRVCSLVKISSEKQTTFSYHFIQYMHIKKKQVYCTKNCSNII